MQILFTKHAIKKFKDLAVLDIHISQKIVRDAIKKPLHVDRTSDHPKVIATGILDKDHILRVVYKVENDIIIVVTFYPARKGRYIQ